MATQINITKISDEKFTVSFQYDSYLVRRIKTLSGAEWSAESKLWFVDCKGGMMLVEGQMKHVNQLAMVRSGHLNPNFSAQINYTNLCKAQ